MQRAMCAMVVIWKGMEHGPADVASRRATRLHVANRMLIAMVDSDEVAAVDRRVQNV